MIGAPTPTDIWAKLKRKNGKIVAWHPLLAHSADVAAVFMYLMTHTVIGKRFAHAAGWSDLTKTHWQRLMYLAALHDIGKTCGGFQQRATQPVGSNHLTPLIASRHHTFTARLFNAPAVATWVEGDAIHWIAATISHHGGPVSTNSSVPATAWDGGKCEAILLSDTIRSWFPSLNGDVEPFPNVPLLQHIFNGALTLADWIASDERFFPFDDPTLNIPAAARGQSAKATELRGKWAMHCALERAEDAAKELGLKPKRSALTSPVSIKEVLAGHDPYDIQQAVGDLPVLPGGSVAALESDTGSGKTEAALARFFKLYQAGEVDGLYFAVPTRSAATELHTRVTNAVQRLFPKGKAPMVAQAVPGQAKANHNKGTRISPFQVDWQNSTLQKQNWAAESSKKYLAAPIAVGTIDQAFMSVLQARHAHMRSSALMRHLLVVDEVHSSDTYMTELQTKVVNNQLAASGHVLLMSATLSSEARHKLLTGTENANSSVRAAKIEKYPLLSWAAGKKRTVVNTKHGASSGNEKTVDITHKTFATEPTKLAADAVKKARAGAKVLIIRNKVDDCVATQKAVEAILGAGEKHLLFSAGGTAAPHHSRYSGADRRLLDEQIERELGKGSARGKGKIIVATSTVEQSLDVDVDVLYSDLCPIDVLLQRIGRAHRHDNPRPLGFEKAQVYVLTDGKGNLVRAIDEEGKAQPYMLYAGLGLIHSDLRALETTRRYTALNPTWFIPRDNRRLVEGCMHSGVFARLTREDKRWKEHAQVIENSMRSDQSSAEIRSIPYDKPYNNLTEFSALDDRVRTRLGIDNHDVEFDPPLPGPFGKDVYKLSVPGWWMQNKVTTDVPNNVVTDADGFNFTFCGSPLRYDRFGLQRIE